MSNAALTENPTDYVVAYDPPSDVVTGYFQHSLDQDYPPGTYTPWIVVEIWINGELVKSQQESRLAAFVMYAPRSSYPCYGSAIDLDPHIPNPDLPNARAPGDPDFDLPGRRRGGRWWR